MLAPVRRGALFALTALALALPATARAESTAPRAAADTTVEASVVPAGPTVAAAAVAVKASQETSAATDVSQSRAGLGRPRALMFVGLGTFIAGALIGGDAGTIIMIGGAAVGLWGLYQYLQ